MGRAVAPLAVALLGLLVACGPPAADSGNPLETGTDNDEVECQKHMTSIYVAQAMYYAENNGYMSDISDVYQYIGRELVCPSCGEYYLLDSDGETYFTVACPLPELPNHGSYGSENPPPCGPPDQVCHNNMMTMATAEQMYYADHNTYTSDWGNIRQAYMQTDMPQCPSCGEYYYLNGGPEHFCVMCPNPSEPNHGYILDGYCSWQDDDTERAGVEDCRANMMLAATAEAMHYATFDEYTDSFSELAHHADVDSLCPACGNGYVLRAEGDHYAIRCTCPTDPEHGSVVDGVASW